MTDFDLIIIGGGPGGYVAAIRAAQLKLKVALVEAHHLGGICLNWGCIPTKALLRSAEVLRLAKHAKTFGVVAGDVASDLNGMVARSRGIADKLSQGVEYLMKKNNIQVFNGMARLSGGAVGKRSVVVAMADKSEKTITAKNIILATGARPKEIAGFETDGVLVWHYKHALKPKKQPKTMIILGSGAIGIEFASFYNEIGVKVTVVELLPRILPQEDTEISTMAEKILATQGIDFKTNSKAEKLSKTADGVKLDIKTNKGIESLTADVLLSAVGITANSENLGLEKTAIKLEKGFVATNQWAETAEAGIYAIGDMGAPPWLAHKAEHEGVIAVEHIAGVKPLHPLNKDNIPSCTYCHPQIASVGLTEDKAKEKNIKTKIGRFPFQGNGKAIALGEDMGMVKIIFDAKTGELLGAHLIGAEVTELIHSFTLSRNLETTEAELIHSVFPHPTLSEMIHESAMAAFGRAIHI
ncbi:MAG: dihydrolipoyl dehydrogenase [Alphaproteobacteria bacterium]